jgi:hypothetical protein
MPDADVPGAFAVLAPAALESCPFVFWRLDGFLFNRRAEQADRLLEDANADFYSGAYVASRSEVERLAPYLEADCSSCIACQTRLPDPVEPLSWGGPTTEPFLAIECVDVAKWVVASNVSSILDRFLANCRFEFERVDGEPSTLSDLGV